MRQMSLETLEQAFNVNAIVAILNHKYAVNHDNEDKVEVLTEVLNEVKLLLQPTVNDEVH